MENTLAYRTDSDLLDVLDEPINRFAHFTARRGGGTVAEAAARNMEARREARRAAREGR